MIPNSLELGWEFLTCTVRVATVLHKVSYEPNIELLKGEQKASDFVAI